MQCDLRGSVRARKSTYYADRMSINYHYVESDWHSVDISAGHLNADVYQNVGYIVSVKLGRTSRSTFGSQTLESAVYFEVYN